MDQFNFNNWPYSNFEQLNLDSILDIVKNTVESVENKQDAPADPGTAGQVLGLDEQLQPVWVDQSGGGGGGSGEDGVTFIPAVSQEGIISWTNDGGLPNPEPVNIKGPQGETGATGPQGETGATGPQGPQGPAYTLTAADKAAIVSDVLAALPTWTGGSY